MKHRDILKAAGIVIALKDKENNELYEMPSGSQNVMFDVLNNDCLTGFEKALMIAGLASLNTDVKQSELYATLTTVNEPLTVVERKNNEQVTSR